MGLFNTDVLRVRERLRLHTSVDSYGHWAMLGTAD